MQMISMFDSSVIPFSSCLHSCPTSGSFPMSQFFTSGGQTTGASASASVLPMKIQVGFQWRFRWTVTVVIVHSDCGAQEKNVCYSFHCFPIYLPWSDGTGCHDLKFCECWILSQLFLTPISPSSRGSSVPLCFLPLGWCHLHIWSYWYFSQQSWFQTALHPARRFSWCTLHTG